MSHNCDYVKQLTETCRLVAEGLGLPEDRWRLVYQSRSGRPQDPWLEPDIVDYLKTLPAHGIRDVVVSPIGFLSDHIEVLFDLDTEAKQACEGIGLNMVRAATIDADPRFVGMIRELIQERLGLTEEKRAIGRYGPHHDACPEDCCLYVGGRRPGS